MFPGGNMPRTPKRRRISQRLPEVCAQRNARRQLQLPAVPRAYTNDENVFFLETDIGEMEIACNYCEAKKFAGEPPGFCCASGKIQLDLFPMPPHLSAVTAQWNK